MVTEETYTYEKLYFALWEISQRYRSFTQFRVIGKSHDDRMIPMLEAGEGQACIFCIGGFTGTDRQMPRFLAQMAEEYCQAYECDWIIGECYRVRELLGQVRICFVPLMNPDGYEICTQGYRAVRNPVFRQMLKMQGIPFGEFHGNARGIDLKDNFPTPYYPRRQIHQEPASENETRALVHIFQEYEGLGLLSFGLSRKKIVYCRQNRSFAYNQKCYRLARHLQKCSEYHLEKGRIPEELNRRESEKSSGTPEQFYAEVMKQPSLMIETPFLSGGPMKEQQEKKEYGEICQLPLEYIYSLSL